MNGSTIIVEVVTPPQAVVVVDVLDYGGPPISYSQLPPGIRQVPISFGFAGKIPMSMMVNVPMGFAVSVPVDLAGIVTFAMTKAAAPANFILNRVAGGIVTQLGILTFTTTNGYSNTASGPGGLLNAKDVLQIITPSNQDISLADIGITVMADSMG